MTALAPRAEPRAAGRSPGAPGRSRLRWALGALACGCAGAALLAALPEIRSALAIVPEADPAPLGLALALQTAAVAALPQVYRSSVEAAGGRIAYARAARVSMGAVTLARLLPGGGAAGAVFAARRLAACGVAAGVAATAVALTGAVLMLTLAGVVTVAAALSVGSGLAPPPVAAAAGMAACALAVFLLAARAALRSAAARDRVLAVVARALGARVDVTAWRGPVELLAAQRLGPCELRATFGWAVVYWSCEAAGLWAVFLAFGVAMPAQVLVVGLGVANLFTALPHAPGGLGAVEAGMAGTYAALGVPAGTAVVAVLGYRLVSYWLPVLAGVPAYLGGRRS